MSYSDPVTRSWYLPVWRGGTWWWVWQEHATDDSLVHGVWFRGGNPGDKRCRVLDCPIYISYRSLGSSMGCKGIKRIYNEGLELKGQGKPIQSFYEKPRLIDTRLSHVLGLEDTMRWHGLRWLTNKLGKYSPLMVREFYTTYAMTILQDLPKRKKPLDQPRLQEVLVRGWQVNILEKMIRRV